MVRQYGYATTTTKFSTHLDTDENAIVFIKNEYYGTNHTFKNYFATVFSVFNKISGIQTY